MYFHLTTFPCQCFCSNRSVSSSPHSNCLLSGGV